VTWAERIDLKTGRPVEANNIRYETGEVFIWPAGIGAHVWMAMSYSPQAGLVYIPYMQMGAHFMKGQLIPGGIHVAGLSVKEYYGDATDGKGALVAWDPLHQKAAWKAPLETIWNGGAMATAGNVVFQGAGDGSFSAYNAKTGARLWRTNAGMGIIASPMTYAVGGKQYVSILAGYGGSASAWGDLMNVGWKYAAPRRLLTFALDGKAALPRSLPPDRTVHAVDDPSLKLNPADVAAGHELYVACMACHGRELIAIGGPAPDLRESQIALDPEGLWRVVHDGALMPKGMPQFPMFSREQVRQIYAFVRASAREVLSRERPSSTPQ
jgi:quinohemoprotein ethanol dehydrogenase